MKGPNPAPVGVNVSFVIDFNPRKIKSLQKNKIKIKANIKDLNNNEIIFL